MTAVLEGVSGQQHAPASLYPRKEPVPILQETGWAPGPVWTGGKSRPRRDSIPDLPARSQSLYRLSYPGHCTRDVNFRKLGSIYAAKMPQNSLWFDIQRDEIIWPVRETAKKHTAWVRGFPICLIVRSARLCRVVLLSHSSSSVRCYLIIRRQLNLAVFSHVQYHTASSRLQCCPT